LAEGRRKLIIIAAAAGYDSLDEVLMLATQQPMSLPTSL